MRRINKYLFSVLLFVPGIILNAQEKELQLTTGVGVNKIQGRLGKVFRSTVAFNSGFEKELGKKWFAQLEANFNSLSYDQRLKDDASEFLFQNTNSSLFMIGLNGGKDFQFGDSRWFGSLYGGTGYINIGEPRVSLDELNNIITQKIIRRGGILGKAGGRIGVKTGSKFFQTLFLDGSYWTSSIKPHGYTFRSLSLFVGMKMVMR